MWRPDDVVVEDKCKARVVWSALLAVMCAYIIWTIYSAIGKRGNPSTTTTLSNSLYPFPDVAVCFGEMGYYGCAAEDHDGIEACVDSALESAFFGLCSDEDAKYLNATRSDYSTRFDCVNFNLSALEVGDGEQDVGNPKVALMNMNWDNAEYDWEENFSETVLLYIEDSAPMRVPYDRLVEGNNTEYMTTTMTTGLTKRNYLAEASDQLYSVLTMSSTTEHMEAFYVSGVNGYLGLYISLSPYSLTTITEVDPLEVATLLGSIGGFWEIMILAWGVFFVAAYRSAPSLNARSLPGKKRSLPSPEKPADEAAPAWDKAHAGTGEEDEQYFTAQEVACAAYKGQLFHRYTRHNFYVERRRRVRRKKAQRSDEVPRPSTPG